MAWPGSLALELEERAGERAERATERGAERGKEPAGIARSIGADVEQLRGDAQRAAKQIRIHAEEPGEALQCRHLPLKSRIGEIQLIPLRLVAFGNSLLPGQLVGEVGKARGVARARQAVLRRLLERIEGAGERTLRLSRHRCFVRRAESGIVQNILKLRQEEIPDLLLVPEKLLVHCVDVRELLIGQLPRLCLCATSHENLREEVKSAKLKVESEKPLDGDGDVDGRAVGLRRGQRGAGEASLNGCERGGYRSGVLRVLGVEAEGRRESNRVAGVEVPGSGLRRIGHVNSDVEYQGRGIAFRFL